MSKSYDIAPKTCGCMVKTDRGYFEGTIQRCPLHEAAGALLTALENTARLLIAIQSRYHGDYVGHCAGCAELPCWIDHAHEQARDAIAQTKGE